MRNVIMLFAFLLFTAFSCVKDEGCMEVVAPACQDQVPQGEMCDAYFERWFYSQESNACMMVAYSGCSEKGFATQQECEACKENTR